MFQSNYQQMLCLLTLLAALILTGCPTPAPEPLAMPDVTNMVQSEAETLLMGMELVISETEAYDDAVPVGHILPQDPAPDTEIFPGDTVHMVISKGVEKVTVPDVVTMSASVAQNEIQNAGLQVGAITEEYSDTIAEGNVISQSPEAGISLEIKSSVDLILSKGLAPVAVPNVLKLSLTNAQSEIQNAGLQVGAVTEEYSDTVAEGNVIRQNPEADTIVLVNSLIQLVVSKGPATLDVPNMIGMTLETAQSALQNTRLALEVVSEKFNSTVPDGTIISQNPEAGITANAGSTVTLSITRIPEAGDTMSFKLGHSDMEFVWCPAATFMMGSPEDEPGRAEEEIQHEVTLTKGFWIGKYEVTQAQWELLDPNWELEDSPFISEGPEYPMIGALSDLWGGIEVLNSVQNEYHFTVPTEAQWEYACRAGSTGMFCYGDDPNYEDLNDYAWTWQNSGNELVSGEWEDSFFNLGFLETLRVRPGGEKLPNAWGIYDMHGNVWENCSDVYDITYYENSPAVDPTGPEPEYPLDHKNVVRGGDVMFWTSLSRSAARTEAALTSIVNAPLLGLRLVAIEEELTF